MNSRAKEYFFNCFGSMVSVNGSSVCAEAKVYVAVGRLCFARLPASQGDAVHLGSPLAGVRASPRTPADSASRFFDLCIILRMLCHNDIV